MIILKLCSPLFICITIASLLGCNVIADEKTVNTADHMQSLAWVDSANAEKDTKKAIAKKDYRLYVVAGRGERVVGIAAAQANDFKQRCGTQYIQGSTDAIRGDRHMEALRKAYEYAEKYNQIMVKHCSN